MDTIFLVVAINAMAAVILRLDGAPTRPLRELESQAALSLYGDDCQDAAQLTRTCFSAQMCSVYGASRGTAPTFGGGWLVAQDANGYCASLLVSADVPADVAALVPAAIALQFVSDMCVAHDRRRGGIGRRLMQRAISMHPTSALALTVHTPPMRPDADRSPFDHVVRARYPLLLRFYQSLGFCRVGRAKNGWTVMVRFPSAHRQKNVRTYFNKDS